MADIDGDLMADYLSPARAGSRRGSLGWARSFLFGRYGSAILVPLRRRQYEAARTGWLSPSIIAALHRFRRALLHNLGREMPFSLAEWRLVVTISDGEGTGSVAVGVWMPREKEFTPLLTRADVPPMWLSRWSRQGSRGSIITEVEALGPLLALCTWPHILKDALWIHFVDNEAAKFSLIKGSSLAVDTHDIVHMTWEFCMQRRLYPWWDRVSTKDNPVDQASRRNLKDLYSQGWQIVEPTLPHLWACDLVHSGEDQSFQ